MPSSNFVDACRGDLFGKKKEREEQKDENFVLSP